MVLRTGKDIDMKHLLISACMLALVPAAYAGDVTVTFSEEFAEKLEKELGEREGVKLSEMIVKDVTDAFAGDLDQIGAINVTIVDARANRPTFKELGDTPGLSMQSFSVGGASLTGDVLDAEGNVVSSLSYKYFENDIRFAQGRATWSDARRSFDRFADKLAKQYRADVTTTDAGL
jgi:hypothetical protein